ncbi:MAG TPA: bifunctional helix-turn-helix transcriptional regulator/GNAT family N-acetyltransferase [Pseudolabrys sp.]|nr:bifunctional helix-turn-helix transcriptional regulator/GNAT family N-acetyltransferase [Pseudolabrys sp.]
MNGNSQRAQRIAAVRRFNRFYTRQIGVLRKGYLNSPYSLGEMRVLYEVAHGARTATEIVRNLDLDAGYLSRVLRQFEKRGYIRRTASAEDARQSRLAMTQRGRKAFAPMDKGSQTLVGTMLDALDPAAQSRLVAAMVSIESLLNGKGRTEKESGPNYILREPKPGDFGWLVKRHAEIYAQEYGWTEPFEGLCAQIVADFVNNNDPKCERCWIAELDGENAGAVMIVRDSADVARLRLLLVEPHARGLGIGARLVDECVKFSRDAGYKKITLWTHSVLTAARRIYENAGFRLTASEARHTWSKDVVAEFWDLEL